MADTTATQAASNQADTEADECRENIPPRAPNVIDSSKLEDAGLNGTESFTSKLEEDNVQVFDAHVFSTPAPKNKTSEAQAKSRWSGVPSALTPILKHLNIGNKSSSSELFTHRNSPKLAVPFSFPAENRHKSIGEPTGLINGEDFSMLYNEGMPEGTLFDLTADSMIQQSINDSMLPESQPVTPQLYGKETHAQTNTRDHQNSLSAKVDESLESALSFRGIMDNYLPEITLLDVSRDSELSPLGQMSSTDVAPVTPSAGHLESSRAPSDQNEQIMMELGKSDTVTNEELSGASVNSAQCSRQTLIKGSLEATQDFSMGSTLENSGSSSETSGQKVEKSQNSEGPRILNVTCDLCSSVDTSQDAAISSSGVERSIPEVYSNHKEKPDSVDAEIDTKVTSKGSKQSPEPETTGQEVEKCQNSDNICTQAMNITHEIDPIGDTPSQTALLSSFDLEKSVPGFESEPKEKPESVEAKTEELPTSCDSKLPSKESHQSLKSDVSANGTFTVGQPSKTSTPPEINTTAPSSSPKNETLDLTAADVSNPKGIGESRDQQTSVNTKTEASLDINQSGSGEKEGTYSIVQNATVDGDSLQNSKLQISSALGKTVSLGHQNGTFDCKVPSQQNGTITLSEISSSESRSSVVNTSAPKAPNSTSALKHECSEEQSSKLLRNEATATVEPEVKQDGSPKKVLEAIPALEPADGRFECRDLSQSGPPVSDSFSDLSNHQSSDTVTIKARSFNLDETLDLRAECLTTSTPMPTSKVFSYDRKQEVGQVLVAQKKLYREPPNEPSHTMPSNIVGDRKTFFKQPAAKHLPPPSKTASQLLKRNPAAAATGLPVKQPKTNCAPVSEEQQKTSVSNSYNLRSLASKLPTSGLQRPQPSGIPVGLPRAAPSLRTRINTSASSSTEKPSGPTAAIPVPKNTQGKRQTLPKGAALPVSKRKKTDASMPSSSTEAPASACDAANGLKTLKQPTTSQRSAPDKASKPDGAVPASTAKTGTFCDGSRRGRSLKPPVANQRAHLTKPQSHGCAKCSVLEEKIRMQSEEIRRLKEELLKYVNPVDS